jgi:methylenetetrahydrofolate--tRNA-(uracil-5-)-methyltransferase
MSFCVHVIGAGLAGCEAAWQIARAGGEVVLYEMRPHRMTGAHQGDGCAELVCSNSLRADDPELSAIGLLHQEMRRCGSLILAMADAHRVPAGGALAVDREGFSAAVGAALAEHPRIHLRREEVTTFPGPEAGPTIIATGPLTSPALADSIRQLTGEETLSFYDAIAPIVEIDSVDLSIAWFQSRYDKIGTGPGESGGKDYINCPLDKPQYLAFRDALLEAETVAFREWEQETGGSGEKPHYFEGCLPIEVMAARGVETLRFGPMKPVGLTDPRTGRWPYAVVQLRQDNALATLYNLVGFQTKLRHGEQARLFRTIPGLENARFARLGGIHRNTFLKSPLLLRPDLALKKADHVRFAGQITGCEGYVESAAIGLLAGWFTAAAARGTPLPPPPITTALGALLHHITGGAVAETFQPMNITFGLFPPPMESSGKRLRGQERKRAFTGRARAEFTPWLLQAWPAEDGIYP